MLVDRAPTVDQHRTVASLVVPHEDMTSGHAWRGEQQLGRDVREGVDLVRFDVDELRRRAAGGAPAARHVGLALAPHCPLCGAEPRREVARVNAVAGRVRRRLDEGHTHARAGYGPLDALHGVGVYQLLAQQMRLFRVPSPPAPWSASSGP